MGRLRDLQVEPDLHPELGLLLGMLDDGTFEWRQELGRVGKATVAWQPFPGGHSIGALMLHIADVELYWVQEVAAGRPVGREEGDRLLSSVTDQYAVRWPRPPVRPLSWYFEVQDEIRGRTRAVVRELGDPEHIAARSRGRYTLRWILHHVITHEAYHGGQAVFLSLLRKRMPAPASLLAEESAPCEANRAAGEQTEAGRDPGGP